MAFLNLTADSRPEPKTPFARVLHELLDDLFRLQPIWATQVGYHAFDDRWPDATDAGRSARCAAYAQHRDRLRALDDGELSADEQIDRALVVEALDGFEFEESVLREHAWDALSVVRSCGSGLFGLLAREFAPWEHRGSAFVERLRSLPEFLHSSADALTGTDDRHVSALSVQVAP